MGTTTEGRLEGDRSSERVTLKPVRVGRGWPRHRYLVPADLLAALVLPPGRPDARRPTLCAGAQDGSDRSVGRLVKGVSGSVSKLDVVIPLSMSVWPYS
jgi:hypothetical protein